MHWHQVGIIFSDRQGRVLDINEGFTQLLGYTREEMLSGEVKWSEVVPADQKQCSQWATAELKCSGSHPPFIRDYLHRNGQRVSLLVQSFYLRQEDGFYVGVLQNLSPFKPFREATSNQLLIGLRHRETLVKEHPEVASYPHLALPHPMGVCFFDRELRYTQINPVLASINGYSIAAHWGQKFRDLLPKYAVQYEPLLQHVLMTGNPIFNLLVSGEVPSQPEQYGHWLVSYHPIRTSQQKTIGVGVTITEIHRLKVGQN